ncbi:unnamed protein product, partial [Staurois parvus]
AHAEKEEDFWDSVLWSDETKINVFGTDGFKSMVSQRRGVQKKMHGAYSEHNVLLWGCMSAACVGEMHFIEGIMNSQMYWSILKEKFFNMTVIQNTHLRPLLHF